MSATGLRTVLARIDRPWPRLCLGAATVVAAVATGGSLWLSLGLGLVPCELCWYQRILMYPLVVVLAVGALEGRVGAIRTAAPFVALGLPVAAYHSYLQWSALQTGVTQCSFGGDVSCAVIQYSVAGLSVPNLSTVAFSLIGVALLATVLVE